MSVCDAGCYNVVIIIECDDTGHWVEIWGPTSPPAPKRGDFISYKNRNLIKYRE